MRRLTSVAPALSTSSGEARRTASDLGRRRRRRQPLGLMVVPFDANTPYQRLLYEAMGSQHQVRLFYWRRRRWIGILSFLPAAAVCRLRGFKIVHLHWMSFYVSRSLRYKRTSYWTTLVCLTWVRLLGLRLVWTVHNVLPHEPVSSDDGGLVRRTVERADLLILHSETTREVLTRLGVPSRPSVVIPHGGLAEAYPEPIGAGLSRAGLGLSDDDRVFLLFGNVRSYKGVEDLIACAGALGPQDRVVIVGGCGEENLRSRLERLEDPRFVVRLGFVPDSQVRGWYELSDIVCLPFRAVTTSGSALLALSLGKPVLAPRLGALEDLPESVGFFYDPTTRDGLRSALVRASSAGASDVRHMGEAALRYASLLSWDALGERTWQALNLVLSSSSADIGAASKAAS